MRRLRRTSPLAAIALLPGLARSQPSVGCPLAPDSAVLAALRARVEAGQAAGLALLAGTLLPATSPTAATRAAQAAPRPAIAPPAAALDRLVGDYSLAPTFVLAVRREGDHLTVQATGQPAFELLAESPTTFRLRAVDARLEFQTDASGAVTGLVLVQNGVRQPALKRTAPPAPTAPVAPAAPAGAPH